jgi:hypothetical protein
VVAGLGGIFLCFHLVEEIYGWNRHSWLSLLVITGLSVGITLGYLFPYWLWMRGTIPNHGLTTLFACGLVLSGVIGANQVINRRFPPGKRKYEELFFPEEEDIDEIVNPDPDEA